MENLSIRCGRPAFRYCAGRLGFWVFLAQKQGENIMAQEFLPNSDDSDRPNDGSAVAEQEILRVAVTGSRDGVLQTISTLHRLGFAKAGDWSRLQMQTAVETAPTQTKPASAG